MNPHLPYYPFHSRARSLPSCVKYTTCASSLLTDDCQQTTDNSYHTFSSKERDSETGLSYFGSRYYSSDLSIWLSVDPMAAKYASLSPYNYCANNPVKLVDPNGEEWEVNESGYVRQVGDENNNTLYVVKGTLEFSFGERKTKEDGSFISMMADEKIMKTMTCDGKNFTGFIANDKRDKMIEMFNFMADNTNVEWAMIGEHIEVGSNTIQTDFLYTNHDNVRCDARFDRVVSSGKNFNLDYHRHSHPNQYTGNNPIYAIYYPISSHYASTKDRNLRDAASPSNYVSMRPIFILRNQSNNIFY
ncbi:MAG: hypothetical protein IKU03_04295 [Bacteroidales bacterium]|nr:hypothetical protein [Bacteroidales bacterium]